MLRVPLALREEGSGHEGGSVLAQSVGSLLDEREREADQAISLFSPPLPHSVSVPRDSHAII